MYKKFISIIVVVISIVVSAAALIKVEPKVKQSEAESVSINRLLDNSMSSFEQTKVFDRDVESFMKRWELKGATFALMRNDSLIYAKGYGYANDTLMCDVNNLFRVASVSKLLTAVAVMKLYEQGQLSMDSQVFGEQGILNDSIFLNLYNKSTEKITVEHLLRHTAGFSTPHGDPAFANSIIARIMGKQLPLTVDDLVEYASQNRLRNRAGDNYDYSNLGYIVLGKVVERVSGVSYESYLQDSILSPIGCYDMYIGRNFEENRGEREVNYYEVKEATAVEAYDGSGRITMKSNGGNNVTLLSGAGGWVSSSTELLRFVSAVNGCDVKEDILSKQTIDFMTRDNDKDRPIGWASVRGEEWLRSGSMAGTSALIKRQSDGYTWVFISNYSAWIGPRLTSYISSHISRALAKVTEWPERDLFEIDQQTTQQTAAQQECEGL